MEKKGNILIIGNTTDYSGVGRLKGMGLDMISSQMDACMASCEEACKNDPNLVILYDLESGYPYTCTREYREKYLAMLEEYFPKTGDDLKISRKIIMFGTGGEVEGKNDFNDIWNNG